MVAGTQGHLLDGADCTPRAFARDSMASFRMRDFASVGPALYKYDDGLETSDWEGCVLLPRAEIRLQPRWRSILPKMGRRRSRKRQLVTIATLAMVTLTAACASAVKSTPGDLRAPAMALNDLGGASGQRPLPSWRALRAANKSRPPGTVIGTNTENPSLAPSRGTPDAVEKPPEVRQASLEDQSSLWRSPSVLGQRSSGLERPVTELVAFDSAPFPYDGMQPQGGAFLDVSQDGRRGHRTRRGQILWESTTFNDSRVLVHIPAGFDPSRPAVMVVFFHGFGATLTRDILTRQQVPAQISASGANAVLLAPQFAVDARDASAGRFWEPGGFARFLGEASRHLADLQGDPGLSRRFAKMPVVLVAYSGGFVPAAWSLKDIAASNRVRGVLLLDAAYGELERFANFAASNRSSFLVSAYTSYTQRQNSLLESMLASRGVSSSNQLNGPLSHGGAVFLSTGTDASHTDYVTQAWTGDPIKDILTRLPEYRLREPQTIAAVDRSVTPTARY